ncbi:OmpA family protein [Chitinophaga sp. S165]|uniref:OmpA family protein n=1 Tax=Chitinophaga sp. S165 TaxID=2135462 RepID=UPI000D71AD50|nr:OmpA family protein [Chitinophaga sp. S165]PWV56981.1 outer membrane protein OmpA-like peptidoglycan-associated protein [Chitinophaga sp. S165]
MRKIHYALSLCLLFSSVNSMAQYVIKEADKQYEVFKYAEAISLYEEAYNKKATLHAAERLGDCYRLNNNYVQAERWYAIATGMPDSKADNLFFYARALQNNSKYAEAKVQYQNYATAGKNVPEDLKNTWIASCDSAISWMKTPSPLKIDNNRSLNSEKSDWSAVSYQGGMVFTSDRFTDKAHQPKKHSRILRFDTRNTPDPLLNGWTGNDYLHLFYKPGNGDSVQLFPLETGTGYHVGSASFTKDGKEMYFTLTRIPGKGNRAKGKAVTVNIEIYSSRQDASGKWSAPLAFTHNNVTAYSVGDPFITEDGMALYFSSNMPGGAGGTDLYVCYRTAVGEWGPPLNLKELNTPGNERSPAVTKKHVLFFASDGRIGMGGLDIFRVALDNTGKTKGTVRNMGYPFNSPQDDFAFGVTEAGIAYLSSNRDGGVGSDDIYTVARLKEGESAVDEPSTTAQDTINKVPVAPPDSASVPAGIDPKGNPVATTPVPEPAKDSVTTTPIEPVIPDIYFDFNKADIRADAQPSLEIVVKLLADIPGSIVEVGSHTDSRGNDAFNLQLSQKRAASVANYLVGKGVEKARIKSKGYGETKLRNKCGNGVTCSEEEHKLNRRTEFKIVK